MGGIFIGPNSGNCGAVESDYPQKVVTDTESHTWNDIGGVKGIAAHEAPLAAKLDFMLTAGPVNGVAIDVQRSDAPLRIVVVRNGRIGKAQNRNVFISVDIGQQSVTPTEFPGRIEPY